MSIKVARSHPLKLNLDLILLSLSQHPWQHTTSRPALRLSRVAARTRFHIQHPMPMRRRCRPRRIRVTTP